MITFDRIKKNVYILISHGIVARTLSFLQVILIANYIGTSMSTDTYFLAFSATMLLTKVLTESMLVSLIPIYQQIDKRDGMKGRVEFTNNVLSIYLIFAILLVVIGLIFAPLFIRILGPGFTGEKFEQTVRLYRIGAAIIIFDIIRVIGSGYLQSIHAFKAGARSGISYNLVFIIYIIFLSPYFGLEGLMVAGIVAVISQIYILWRVVYKGGYRYKFYILFKDRLISRLNSFMFIVIMSVGINEVNLAVDNAIGSTLATGTIAELNYANDIITFFVALIITSLVTAIFPVLSQRFRDGDPSMLRKSFRYSLKLILLVTIPIAILFISMSVPMVRIFYERGEFGYEDTIRTASILRHYSPAIIGMSLIMLISRIFYAVHSLTTPLILGGISLVSNIVISIILSRIIGAEGIALGTSISVGLVTLYALIRLNMIYGLFTGREILEKLGKIVFASLSMIVVILYLVYDVGEVLQATYLGNMSLVIISGIIGVMTFWGVAYFSKL